MIFIFDKEFENFEKKPEITHHDEQQQQEDIPPTPTNIITSNNVNGNGVDFTVDISSASSTASGSTSISADSTPPNERHNLINFIPQECSADCPNHHNKLPLIIKQNHQQQQSYRSLSDIFGRTFINGWF